MPDPTAPAATLATGTSREVVLDASTVLLPTPDCVIREQRDEYLIYNSSTDELHLISPQGRHLVLLCNGLNTVAQIQAMVGPGTVDVAQFLAKLIARGVLRPVGDEEGAA